MNELSENDREFIAQVLHDAYREEILRLPRHQQDISLGVLARIKDLHEDYRFPAARAYHLFTRKATE